MAKKKSDGEEKAGGPKKFALPAVFLLVGMFAGPKVLGGGGGGEASEATTTTTEEGPVITMDSTTLNLADGHLLKVGIGLQISAEWYAEHSAEEEGHSSTDETDPTKGYARAMDTAITVLSGMTYEELLAPGGRNIARAAIEDTLHEEYHGEIESVLFYEFVMQ